MKLALTVLLIPLLAACASSTKQADELLSGPSKVPVQHEVSGVPYLKQEAGYCGPATLAMAMNWAGHAVTADEIAPLVYTPGAKGSFQTDMISATRREGLIAIPVTGLEALLKEVSAGHPVIVFENLALPWLPQWHYAVVYGYDLQKQTVLMHSGPHEAKRWDIRKFERSWKLADYWAMVVLPPNELSATGDELAHVKAASALEQIGRRDEAIDAYQAILNRWPKSLAALIGMGNWAFQANNYVDAVGYLQMATKAHPDSAAAWHNLALAEQEARMTTSARESAKRALATAPSDSKSRYEESLRAILQ